MKAKFSFGVKLFRVKTGSALAENVGFNTKYFSSLWRVLIEIFEQGAFPIYGYLGQVKTSLAP
jgi:hypothetical protein